MARSLSVGAVLRLKDRIQQQPEILAYIGTSPEGQDFEDFVEEIQRHLPDGIPFHALHDSLSGLLGRPITSRALDAVLWRLAGNLGRLHQHQPVYEWSGQAEPEWVPFQILLVHPQLTRRGDLAGEFFCQALKGTPCPGIVKKFWTRRFCFVLARRMGFTSSRFAYPFRDMLELVNLRFSGLVTPELSQQGPTFDEVEVKREQITWNRRYLQMRARNTTRFHCPADYPIDHRCYNCPVGMDQCPAAVHEKTFSVRHCEQCQSESYFDPLYPRRDVCVNCYRAKMMQRRQS